MKSVVYIECAELTQKNMKFHQLSGKIVVFLGISLFLSGTLNAIFGLKEVLGKAMFAFFDLGIMLVVALAMYLYSRRHNKVRSAEPGAGTRESAVPIDFRDADGTMTFPLLLLYEEEAPELFVHPEMSPGSDFNPEGYTVYSRDGVYEVLAYSPGAVPRASIKKIGLLDISELKERLLACLEADDDIMTQYYDSDVLEYLLMPCCSFAEVLCWGTLTGCLYAPERGSLPELADDDDSESDIPLLQRISSPGYRGKLSAEYIRRCAAAVKFVPPSDGRGE